MSQAGQIPNNTDFTGRRPQIKRHISQCKIPQVLKLTHCIIVAYPGTKLMPRTSNIACISGNSSHKTARQITVQNQAPGQAPDLNKARCKVRYRAMNKAWFNVRYMVMNKARCTATCTSPSACCLESPFNIHSQLSAPALTSFTGLSLTEH